MLRRVWGRGPRTALHYAQAYIILVVMGAKNYYSIISLHRTRLYHAKLGAVDAPNFDGGGSTVMAVKKPCCQPPFRWPERKACPTLFW